MWSNIDLKIKTYPPGYILYNAENAEWNGNLEPKLAKKGTVNVHSTARIAKRQHEQVGHTMMYT